MSLFTRRAQSIFPWGTFVVNISGAFVIGVVFTVMTQRGWGTPLLRSAITVGFLGSYTTFSTLMIDSYALTTHRDLALAAANVLGSVAAGLVAVYLGVVAGRAL